MAVFRICLRLHRTLTANEDGPLAPSLSRDLVSIKSEPLTATGACKLLLLFSSERFQICNIMRYINSKLNEYKFNLVYN